MKNYSFFLNIFNSGTILIEIVSANLISCSSQSDLKSYNIKYEILTKLWNKK